VCIQCRRRCDPNWPSGATSLFSTQTRTSETGHAESSSKNLSVATRSSTEQICFALVFVQRDRLLTQLTCQQYFLFLFVFQDLTCIRFMSTPSQIPVRYLREAAAQELWQDLLTKSQIPSNSVTARCMFDETQSSRGKRWQFGLTPLWNNEMRKNSHGEVLHSEFMDLARRLLDAGKTRQEARRR
jgi:hypothetical protein